MIVFVLEILKDDRSSSILGIYGSENKAREALKIFVDTEDDGYLIRADGLAAIGFDSSDVIVVQEREVL